LGSVRGNGKLVTILTALSGVLTTVSNLSYEGGRIDAAGYFTDDVVINPDGSYSRKMVSATISHPDFPGIYSLDIVSPAKEPILATIK
jgi:hypothetical protein